MCHPSKSAPLEVNTSKPREQQGWRGSSTYVDLMPSVRAGFKIERVSAVNFSYTLIEDFL